LDCCFKEEKVLIKWGQHENSIFRNRFYGWLW
jgi:hypothetical protein